MKLPLISFSEFGDYPPREMLGEPEKMGNQEREKHLWFGLYLLEKGKNKGKDLQKVIGGTNIY